MTIVRQSCNRLRINKPKTPLFVFFYEIKSKNYHNYQLRALQDHALYYMHGSLKLLNECIGMRWTDIEDIAEALEEYYPDEEIERLRLADLHDLITTLNEFEDDPERYNDRALEVLREAWLEVRANY